MIEARSALFSGDVVWELESVKYPGRRFLYVNRYASNGDRIFEERGDQDGWVTWNPIEKRPESKYPQLYLAQGDGVYSYEETKPIVSFWKRGEGREVVGSPSPRGLEFKDVRCIGIHPSENLAFQHGLHSAYLMSAPCGGSSDAPKEARQVRWEETREQGRIVVNAKLDRETVRWTINPDKGWNAERIETFAANGDRIGDVQCKLRQYGEYWFPETVEHWVNGQLGCRIRVEMASFNQVGDPTQFTPRDIWVEPGFNIIPQNFHPSEAGGLIWEGDRAVGFEEWKRLVESGQREYGPLLAEAQRSGRPPESPYMTDAQRAAREAVHREMRARTQQARGMAAWERYVAEFIQQHSLNPDQTQKAQTILRSCQEEGQNYLNRRRSDFAKAQRAIESARQSGDGKGLGRAAEQLRELRKPMDAIFEERLKPRLDGLLTAAQRAAAASRPAQPAGDAKK
jgi:hypothetical protein